MRRSRSRSFFPSLWLGALALVLASCADSPVETSYHHVEQAEWPVDSIYEFQFGAGHDAPLEVQLFIQHRGSYPYSNLYLFMETFLPDGTARYDTVNYVLAAPSGEWYGRGMHHSKQILLPFLRGLPSTDSAAYTLRVRHGMRLDPLPGIEEVGIQVYTYTKEEGE